MEQKNEINSGTKLMFSSNGAGNPRRTILHQKSWPAGGRRRPSLQSKMGNYPRKIINVSSEIRASTLRIPFIRIEKLHWCNQCRKKFPTARSLSDHISDTHPEKIDEEVQIISDPKTLTCDTCFEEFENEADLNFHKTKHLDEKPYVCGTCGKKFIEASILKIHMAFHDTAAKPFQNVLSGGQITKCSDSKLTEKYNEIPGRRRVNLVTCNVCGKGMKSTHCLKAHMLIHLGVKPYQCDICHLRVSTKCSLKSHLQIHDNIKPFACEICGKRFRKLDFVKYHKRIHMEERPYKCEVCGKGYSRSHDVKVHMSHHTGIRPYECSICKQGFLRKIYLTDHLKTHTNVEPDRPKITEVFTCLLCSEIFRSRAELTAHKRNYCDDLPLWCKTCGMKFKDEFRLKSHMISHSAKKSDSRYFQCRICDKKFMEINDFRDHVKTHKTSDRESYNCPVCHQVFPSQDDLKVHKMVHVDEKPFECEICGKRLLSLHCLSLHRKHEHPKVKSLECDVCQKVFPSKQVLNRHKNTHSETNECFDGEDEGDEEVSDEEVCDEGSEFEKKMRDLENGDFEFQEEPCSENENSVLVSVKNEPCDLSECDEIGIEELEGIKLEPGEFLVVTNEM